jgi:hypothetical protein
MKGAKKMEASFHGHHLLGAITKNYYDQVFGPELTQELVDIFGRDAKYLIREFLFGLDCLIEMIHNPETPIKKFLNNEDVDSQLIFVCQHRARTEQKPELFGCQVGPRIAAIIDEFYEHKYLRIFNYVLMHLRPHLPVPVDGKNYMLYVNKDFSPTTSHAVLYFRDMDQPDKRISIPFKRTRLVS